MKKIIGTLILIGLTAMMLSPWVVGRQNLPETNGDPIFVNVYTVPRYPIGANWINGLGGDIIKIYAEVTGVDPGNGADILQINSQFCNRESCDYNSDFFDMVHVTGNLWMYQLPGDGINKWEYYEASCNTSMYVSFQIVAENATAGFEGFKWYPGPDDTGHVKIYPAFPPSQINATTASIKDTMWTGESFWVNGTSNYWNSTSYPNDFSKLLPADECPVKVKVGDNVVPGKTDIKGNYSVQITAPSVPGNYDVEVTISNYTANRNVSCVQTNIEQVQVNSHKLNISLALNSTTALPIRPLYANGTVKLDGVPVPAGYQVNVSIAGGNYWLVNTIADGRYSASINTPSAVGNYTVNASVRHAGFNLVAWNTTGITVVAVPIPDLVVTNADISVFGNLVEGQSLKLNATVFNKGIAPAVDAMINITLDDALLNSTVRTIAVSANTTVSLGWTAIPGVHYLNVTADPAKTIAESSEANNFATLSFTVHPDFDQDGIGDPADFDDDSDGVPDTEDAFPFDPGESLDTDNDDTGNNADTDDDDDGVLDVNDAFPLDSGEWLDTDEDDIGNNADTDDDADGVPDATDRFPLDEAEWADFDGDGIGDNADTDDDADGIQDNVDTSLWDTDNDGLVNGVDSDDDADGIPDAADQHPLDTNNDGVNNDVDTDDDGDGVSDSEDAFPLNGTETLDTDGDGIGNNADLDDDGDGVLDDVDLDPLDPEIGEPEGGSNSIMIVAVVVIAVVAVVALLVYIFVLRPKP